MNTEVFIVSAVRTPIGKFGGALGEMSAADMGVHVVCAALERAFGEAPPLRTPGESAEEGSETGEGSVARDIGQARE